MSAAIYPVILSGGSGTRLWPLSRSHYPKQLLPLTSDLSMLQETAKRFLDARFAEPLIICNNDHRFIIAQQLRELGIRPDRIVLEPVGRNTAPAVAVACLLAAEHDPEATVLVVPSDHVIQDVDRFLAAVDTGRQAAEQGRLVTFGIPPLAPETGYGYIRRGGPVAGAEGCFEVDAFVEKPDAETAWTYLDHGGYDWNSGMFLLPVAGFLAELERLNPDLLAGCRLSVERAQTDLDFLRLDHDSFAGVQSISVDYAVMEHTDKAAVVPAEMGWNDVGAWSALWDIGAKDSDGNVTQGDVLCHDTADSYIRTDGPLVAAVGVQDLVIVATDDVIMVTPKDRAQDVKAVVETLAECDRTEHMFHTRVYRPWGFFQGIDAGGRYQVKLIEVNPGSKLSLQMHYHRAEHWIVVSGTAQVTKGNDTILLQPNESTFIPLGVTHSLENPGRVPLRLIEVQSGDYLGEDDIVRFEDIYGRAGATN
ncbi:MAG: mannose-1-phosphate guanylyltransferase/mannose-6-phosphate isomerase [Hyphomicrobiales bacterium]|nr:mannose-1-phosphate guanylyltransferase/mannose-6-phosphate isomerase [Hyphomicrobiales bacterium]